MAMTPTPDAPAGVSLLAPDRQCEIPLQFKRNSLAVFAHIRVVNMADDGPVLPEIKLLLHHCRAL